MDRSIAIQKLGELEKLRGQHDQTVRCRVIDLMYSSDTSKKTATERFLETEIIRVQSIIELSFIDDKDERSAWLSSLK